VTHEAIAQRAYQLFCQRGQVHGHALDDWVRAEHELRDDRATTAAERLRGSCRRSPAGC
jgi:hypothetical protein